MSLTKDRQTPYKDGELIAVPLAANAVVFNGGLVCAAASGFGTPGAVATTLTALGVANESANNTGGANGAKSVMVRRKKAFLFKNHGADLVTQASLGKPCYIVDDETVALTNGGTTRSVAGTVLGVDSSGVWVEIG
jgi:hypothetical protein